MHFLSGLLAMREIESQAHVHLIVLIHSRTRFGLSFIQTFSLSVRQSVRPSVRQSASEAGRQAGRQAFIQSFLGFYFHYHFINQIPSSKTPTSKTSPQPSLSAWRSRHLQSLSSSVWVPEAKNTVIKCGCTTMMPPQSPQRKKYYTTWKVDGTTPMCWFIMAPF